jgi:hypothetical protein
MKHVVALAVLAIPYLVGAMLPAELLWYNPGLVHFQDAKQGTAPVLEFTRNIKRESSISYSVVVRNADGAVVCEGRGGPFTYKIVNGPLIGKDLVWWAAGDGRCGRIPVGSYWSETCWKVETPLAALLPELLKTPFGWLLPPKRICRTSDVFNIVPNEPVG